MTVKSSILKVVKANANAKNSEIVEGDLVPTTPTESPKQAVDRAKTGSEPNTKKKSPATKKKSPKEASIAETQPIQEIAELQPIEVAKIQPIPENQIQAFAGATKQKKKSNKVIPPIPERTPEERQAIRNIYKEKVQQQARNTQISFVVRCLDLADASQTSAGQLVVNRIEPCVGIVSDNIAKNSTKFIFPKVVKRNIELLHEYLLSNPSIIDPTWDILVDRDLSVREKGRKLNEIGWEPEIISINEKGQNSAFQRIYLLARILERGIV